MWLEPDWVACVTSKSIMTITGSGKATSAHHGGTDAVHGWMDVEPQLW